MNFTHIHKNHPLHPAKIPQTLQIVIPRGRIFFKNLNNFLQGHCEGLYSGSNSRPVRFLTIKLLLWLSSNLVTLTVPEGTMVLSLSRHTVSIFL